MNKEEVKSRINKIAEILIENKNLLSDLDSAIGDGDHGFNMAKGFEAVKVEMKNNFEDMYALFNKIAMTLISKVGGASGPLYGTFFMKFAASLKGKNELTKEDFAKAFLSGTEGVKSRGKAALNDKTMVDVLEPVAQALEKGDSYAAVIKIAEGKKEYTKEIKANKGRASYLGERSIGHIDPGACSSYLIIKAALEE